MPILTETERSIILGNMESLLKEYDYKYTTTALKTIIDTWAEQKQTLLSAFKRHPNYIENEFCIAFSSDYDRSLSKAPSEKFSYWIETTLEDVKAYFPEDIDTYRTGSEILPWAMFDIVANLTKFASRTLDETTTNTFSEAFPMLRFHTGEKTSRVVNRICEYIGYTKLPDYNREFAKYADSLSPLTIKRHTVLSLNPLDYLTMSFGNSWASCHTIDKQNKRGMPNSYHGQYSSGTISYMLDSTSMVLYTTAAENPAVDYWTQPKINRQMFHWGEEKLIQGRLYPQDNDSDGNAYTPFRNIVQQIISEIFDFPNLWKVSKGRDHASFYIVSEGTHYRDYHCYNNCTLSRVSGSDNENSIIVGHDPICVECGCEHDESESINCCSSQGVYCADCGSYVDLSDAVEIDGEYYCHDCCDWCDYCEEYHRRESVRVLGYGYVCESCLHSGRFSQCEECGEWFAADDLIYVEDTSSNVCEHCLEQHYQSCDDCCDYFDSDHITFFDGYMLCPDCLERRKAELEKNKESEEETHA